MYYDSNIINSCINKGNIYSKAGSFGISTYYYGAHNKRIIINCYNSGNITSGGETAGIGDIAEIYNSYNTGTISSTNNSIFSTPGGIFGYPYNSMSSLNIYNCYNIGKINGGEIGGYWRGNIIGIIRITSPIVKNCYYLDQQRSMGDDNLATKCNNEEITSIEFVNKLNSFIETNGNGDNIDTSNYAKWIKKDDGTVSLDFNTIWNGSSWETK